METKKVLEVPSVYNYKPVGNFQILASLTTVTPSGSSSSNTGSSGPNTSSSTTIGGNISDSSIGSKYLDEFALLYFVFILELF